MTASAFGGVRRNYEIESHDSAGLLRIRGADGELRETGETAREWVGDASAMRPGGFFDHFRPAEKRVLRSSLQASRPRRRRSSSTVYTGVLS